MTREEALENLKGLLESNYVDSFEDAENKDLEMAIKALEQSSYNSINSELNGDMISRQAVLDIVDNYSESQSNVEDVTQDIISDIVVLQPVNSEPKTGHWTRELIRNEKGGCIGAKMICSECGKDNKHDEYMNYCPNCGAKMRKRSDKK